MFSKILLVCLFICQLMASPEKITVGLSADYPPFEFKQGEEIIGLDVDLAKEIGNQLGVEIEFKDMAFASLLSALNQGEIDMVISSVGPNEERRKNFDFSIPYHFDELAILHKIDALISTDNLNSKSVACQLGSNMQIWLNKNAPNTKIVPMDVATQMVEALKAGHVDGVLIEVIQAKEFIKNSKNLAYTIVGNAAEGSAVVLKKGSKLLEKVNNIIEKLKAGGTLKALENKWVERNTKITKHNVIDDFLFVAKGLPTTLTYSFLAIFLGGILGIFLAVSRQLKHGVWAIASVISVIRGTPVLLQLSFVYFAAPALIGIKLSVLVAGVLTLGINSAAYLAEILRSGLQSLPKGQFEVCQALGISKFHTWKDIILPQVLRNVFPALINEIVTLTKETALVSVLGEIDIMRRAQTLAAETYNYFEPMCLAGIIYYLLIKTIEFIGKKLEQRWHHA